MTTTSPSTTRPSSAAAIEAALAELEAQEIRLRARRATVYASLDAAEHAAATALLDDTVLAADAVGKGRPAAAKHLTAVEHKTAAFAPNPAAAAGPALREALADIDRALTEIDARRTERSSRLPYARLRDAVTEWVAIEREIAEREATIKKLWAKIAAYERLAQEFDFPHLEGGILQGLYPRREALRRFAEDNAVGLGVDLAALRAEVAR